MRLGWTLRWSQPVERSGLRAVSVLPRRDPDFSVEEFALLEAWFDRGSAP
jgi:hypothetical protein